MFLALIVSLAVNLDDAAESRRTFTASEKILKEAASLSGKIYTTGKEWDASQEEFLFQKPMSFRTIDGVINQYCNGKVQINHLVAERQFFRRDVATHGFVASPVDALEGFWGNQTGAKLPYFVISTTYRMQTVDRRRCAAKAFFFDSFGRDDRMVFYVDAASKRPFGWDAVFGYNKFHSRFVNLRFNVPVPKGAFEWSPPPGLTEKAVGPPSRH